METFERVLAAIAVKNEILRNESIFVGIYSVLNLGTMSMTSRASDCTIRM